MKITTNFTLEELCASRRAKVLHISNTPPDYVVHNLTELCRDLLQPIRDAWGGALLVTSGYRSPSLNCAVGGSKTSAHACGYAADIVPTDTNVAIFKEWLREWLPHSGLKFDQYIDEQNKCGSQWVHIAIRNRAGAQRGQYLRTSDGTRYVNC